jgi:Preprotein translocase subunit SecA (ATPase, RNA helicase)
LEVSKRFIFYPFVDQFWKDHLAEMELFKVWNWIKGQWVKEIPLVEYQNEGYTLFEDLIENVKFSVIRILMNFDKSFIIQNQENKDNVKTTQIIKDKIGRNDPCYCGSGIKYKKCGMVDKCIKTS